ncbi:SLBB domain-containing protein [Planctomycetota bacterium]
MAELRDFSHLSPSGPAVDLDKVVEAKMVIGPYRVIAGDVIELTIPTILCVETTDRVSSPEGMTTLPYRVTEEGTIVLPVVGDMRVVGMSLADIERAISKVYYESFSHTPPTIFARIQEHRTQRAAIVGAVSAPGIYNLRCDQMSLVSLIMAAGGITTTGASRIRIVHTQEQSSSPASTTATTSPQANSHRQSTDLHMSFRPHGAGHTRGQLTVRHGDRVVLSDTLDVADTQQRHMFLGQLTDKLPRLSLNTVKDELGRLPGVMDSGAGMDTYMRFASEEITPGSRPGFSRYGTYAMHEAPRSVSDKFTVGQADSSRASLSERTIVLPVRGLNIPFADVALLEGDRVTVEPLVMPMFTVIGLVNNQGNFPYPPGESYNLMEAIGFAQGLNRVADPRYAVIYRLTADGSIIHTFLNISKAALDDNELPPAMNVIIRPGDIVDIAQTPRTRTKLFLADVFRFTIGAYIPIWDGQY